MNGRTNPALHVRSVAGSTSSQCRPDTIRIVPQLAARGRQGEASSYVLHNDLLSVNGHTSFQSMAATRPRLNTTKASNHNQRVAASE